MSIRDFDLDLARAITEQLVEHFGAMPSSSLASEEIARARKEAGVYQLYQSDVLVYVGKSDKDMVGRLERHRSTLTGRQNISLDEMSFKGVHISQNWSALTTEAALITHFGNTTWNNSGFGSNDPGRRRDNTAVPPDSFDGMYPIDPGYGIQLESGEQSAASILSAMKRQLPYVLRYDTTGQNCDELETSLITIDQRRITAGEALRLVARGLPTGWQATLLPGRMLLYHETRSYPTGEIM